MWKVATAGDGRQYYYHEVTKQTSWEKPADYDEQAASDALKASAEAASQGIWREAKRPADGRTYYYNTATNATTWEKPASFEPMQILTAAPPNVNDSDRRIERRDNFRDTAPIQRGGGNNPWDRNENIAPAQRGGFDRTANNPWDRSDGLGFRGALPTKTDEPQYSTPAEAEAAFFKFLRSNNIKYDSDWRDVIRALGREKGYRAFKDPRDRKRAFDKYCAEEKVAEKSRERERKLKQRQQFKDMLKLHDEITYYTRWKTAVPLIDRELVFKNVQDDGERKQMFREHIAELQKRHAQEEAGIRERALHELSSLLRTLVASSQTKWEDALRTIESNKRFANSPIFRAISKTDIIKSFETHVKDLDAERTNSKQRSKQNHFRVQRAARDGFKELLYEQFRAGHIRASTKWKDFYPHIKEEKRYKTLLGMPGSSPIELFWDLVEDEDRRLRPQRMDVYSVLEDRKFELCLDTEYAEFKALMRSDPRTHGISAKDLLPIYEKLIEKVQRREEEERKLAEKELQDALDALRSAIKHIRPAIAIDEVFEAVADKIKSLPEARGLDEDAHRMAFDKYIKRAQEKAAEREKDRARRDRDRDQRTGSRRSYDDDERDRRRRRLTNSPEINAYEEDRVQASAARMRQHRNTTFGLTPPPRDRRDDRDRRDLYASSYDRERKERELERQRSYISRADPRDRGKVNTLDYGDEDVGVSSVKKRRESDNSAASKRDPKVCPIATPYFTKVVLTELSDSDAIMMSLLSSYQARSRRTLLCRVAAKRVRSKRSKIGHWKRCRLC